MPKVFVLQGCFGDVEDVYFKATHIVLKGSSELPLKTTLELLSETYSQKVFKNAKGATITLSYGKCKSLKIVEIKN